MAARRSPPPAPAVFSPLSRCAAAYALFVTLATVFSRDPVGSARHLAGVSLLLLIPITIDLVDTVAVGRSVFLALGASGIALSFVGFWQFAHGGDDLYRRIDGGLSHWMTFSGLATIAGCVLLGFLLEDRGRWRAAGLLALVPLTAMVLTFTRNAYVGFLAAIASYLVLRRPRGLVVLVPALVLFFLAVPAPIRARIVSIGSLQDGSNRDRILMVEAGFRMIEDWPVFGIGPSQVSPYYPYYRDPAARDWRIGHLHNNVVQIASAEGLFAAAAYLALVGVFFVRAARALRREEDPARAALLAGAWLAGSAMFVAGLFEYNFGDTEVEMATLLVLAVPFSRALTREREEV
ncbi:MAG TPA: O-antigen ligase family protein, partial [Thermoanaerobaculia bacterium]|nr:O-antigen ligase family protein [Thermoanaerobaculia bacterium]